MKIIHIEYGANYTLPPSICALGYFDGIHRGHQQLIEKAVSLSEEQGIDSSVLTFDPDPWKVLKPDADLSHMTDLDDKAAILERMGIDLFFVVHFTKAFASLDNEAFHEFLASLNIREIVCGFDYTYGKKGSGNAFTLAQADQFKTSVIEQISDREEKISSSRIEALIKDGEMEEANRLMGFFYSLKGTVESGFQRGRQLGFPTANLHFSGEAVVPERGVYAGYVSVDHRLYEAMINIGTNPTFNNTDRTIEANLFDFSGNIYGEDVRFFFVRHLRGEVRFSSIEDLKDQLKSDAAKSRIVLPQFSGLLKATAALWNLKLPS